MVQFYKPLGTNSKHTHTHPKLKGKGKSSEGSWKGRHGSTEDSDIKQWTRPWKSLTFPTLEGV